MQPQTLISTGIQLVVLSCLSSSRVHRLNFVGRRINGLSVHVSPEERIPNEVHCAGSLNSCLHNNVGLRSSRIIPSLPIAFWTSLYSPTFPLQPWRMAPANSEHHSFEIPYPPALELDIMKRSEFGNNGCVVFGWLSSGGVIIKEPADVAALNFLAIDRLKASSRSDNIIEEDAFCNRMRQIGVKWWNN